MQRTRWLPICLMGLACLAPVRGALAQPKIREVTDDDVDRAIQRTVKYLYGRQMPKGDWPDGYYTASPHGGATALCLFALLEAGENPHKDEMKAGLDALAKVETGYLYVRALRIMVLAQALGRSINQKDMKHYKDCMTGDKTWLTNNAALHGAWGYGGPDRTGDNSCSQFALLALWEAARAGIDIGADLAKKVEATWIARQKKDGGWTYAAVGNGDPTPSMTCAGVASMFVCQDVLGNAACKPFPNQAVIDAGRAWLAKELKADFVKNGYLAFCVQRVGLASGMKFIGTMDWFATGARELVKPQPYGPSYGGQWGPDIGASFDLLFLSRGRVPLVFNKLDLGDDHPGWDTHPRDIAQFAEYMRRTFETRARWQVVKISDDLRLLLDAPILLVTAANALKLDEKQWAKLHEYSLRGGMLLFMPVHGNQPFVDSVKAALGTLYAEEQKKSPKCFAFQQVPVADPLYIAHKPLDHGDKDVPLWGVHDGTRWLAVLSTTDLACAWSKPMAKGTEDLFQAGVNMYQYATGKNALGSRMRPVFVGSDQPAKAAVKVGWVRYDGNWNTQPYALDYLSQKLSAENRLSIDLTSGVEPAVSDLSPFKLLWITGTDAVKFSDAQAAALRKYLDDNGTIFINAVGGSEGFAGSADDLITRLGRGRNGGLAAAPADHPLMTGKLGEQRGLPLDPETLFQERALNWKTKGPKFVSALEIYVEDGQARVILGRNGIHDTLDGHMGWGGLSFKPAVSGQLAANIVLYALMDRPKPTIPTSQPESATTAPVGAAAGGASP